MLAFSVKPVIRVAILILLPVTAAASYFMNEYGIVIDTNMVRNIFETDTREAGDLITFKLIAYVGLLGLLPAILFCLIPWTPRTFWDEAVAKFKFAAVALVLFAVAAFSIWGDFPSALSRASRIQDDADAAELYFGAFGLLAEGGCRRCQGHRSIRRGCAPAAEASTRPRKSLFVVVVGETARWDHFALNGYAKPTNPELSQIKDLINYPKAFSCGTDTAQSVPCMFSGLGKANFTNAKADAEENLLDILKRAGVDVLWRENQAGCKGVCARVPTETLTGHKVPTFYPSSENFDDVLVDGIDGADREARSRHRHRSAYDGKPRTGILETLSGQVRDVQADVQGRAVQPLHGLRKSSTPTIIRSSTRTTYWHV